MTLIFHSVAVSDVGLVRTNNEDSAHAGRWLVAVADGIGGAPAGELASDLAIQALLALDHPAEGLDPLVPLCTAVENGNGMIRQMAGADRSNEGMGTTVTALLLWGDQLALVHAGDSRCYLSRAGTFSQVTRDDTFVQGLVDNGVLSPDEVRRHPQRSLVTKAVQGEDLVPTAMLLTAAPGDRFLLCSDGLSDVVPDETLADMLRSYPQLDACAEGLVKLALQGGGPDNITVVLADVVAAA
ncbi:MAG TPA: protein phosphatase 2C domain-containing protein [Micromonosporaceae bacterium]|nr:protein phosphatase 2C domain-containing protein [Micromonosporaceae bacterium]